MMTLLAVVHVLIGLALILFVLLQDPKGGAMGVFSGGGSSNSFFGSTGASNFLTVATTWLAVLFAATCLTLTYMSAKKGGSVMDNFTPSAAAPAAPTAPATEGTPTTGAPTEAAPAAPPATKTK
jgi:preprotein translocase subunit SecG